MSRATLLSQHEFLPEYLNLDEAASFLQISPEHLRYLLSTKEISCIAYDTQGRYWLRHSDVIAWRNQHLSPTS